MIIWINGPEGVGKTTVAEKLNQLGSEILVFDPSSVTDAILQMYPDVSEAEVFSLNIWGDLVVDTSLRLLEGNSTVLVIPMTLTDCNCLRGILERWAQKQVSVYHYFLDIEESKLRNRIEADQVYPEDLHTDTLLRKKRLAAMKPCLASAIHLPSKTLFLDAGRQSADELSQLIARATGITK